jgi:hypothetical protein
MHMTQPHLVRAYGDRQGDGMVQMSFVLPLPPSARAREGAKQFAEKHGLAEPLVSTMEEAAPGFTYFVVYGHSKHEIDERELDVPEVQQTTLADIVRRNTRLTNLQPDVFLFRTSVAGTVFADLNRDGMRQQQEVGLAGTTILLSN